MSKQYLGDSVYAEFTGHELILTTENGYGPSNTIILELEVFMEMVRYMEHMTGLDQKAKDQ